jgi:hypothetical protein
LAVAAELLVIVPEAYLNHLRVALVVVRFLVAEDMQQVGLLLPLLEQLQGEMGQLIQAQAVAAELAEIPEIVMVEQEEEQEDIAKVS